jgi:hypothetical protein
MPSGNASTISPTEVQASCLGPPAVAAALGTTQKVVKVELVRARTNPEDLPQLLCCQSDRGTAAIARLRRSGVASLRLCAIGLSRLDYHGVEELVELPASPLRSDRRPLGESSDFGD